MSAEPRSTKQVSKVFHWVGSFSLCVTIGALIPSIEPGGIRNESKSAKISEWLGAIFWIRSISCNEAVGAKTLFTTVSRFLLPKIFRARIFASQSESENRLKNPCDLKRLVAVTWSNSGWLFHRYKKRSIVGSFTFPSSIMHSCKCSRKIWLSSNL